MSVVILRPSIKEDAMLLKIRTPFKRVLVNNLKIAKNKELPWWPLVAGIFFIIFIASATIASTDPVLAGGIVIPIVFAVSGAALCVTLMIGFDV